MYTYNANIKQELCDSIRTVINKILIRVIPRLQSMAVFVKILGAPKTRIWVRVRKNGQVRQEKFSRCAKIYLSVPKYLRTALYLKAWL